MALTERTRKQRILIIGAGPAGLACAERLTEIAQQDRQYDFAIHVYEQKPSAARKFLMAGKTGLNISHAEPLAQFINRYDAADWLSPMLQRYSAEQIKHWLDGLGVAHFVGSSGRIFPTDMKAAPLLRAWLHRLQQRGVTFHYRQRCLEIGHSVHEKYAIFQTDNAENNKNDDNNKNDNNVQKINADVIVLACGAVSWARLGSDGAWQKWLPSPTLNPFVASNVGVLVAWSAFMQAFFGQPLKRIKAWATGDGAQFGEMVISQYGLEGGLVYRYNRALRQQSEQQQTAVLWLDLLPDSDENQLMEKLTANRKQSLNTQWHRLGLDKAKIAVLRDIIPKSDWHNPQKMAYAIKHLAIAIQGTRPIDEAISCAGGVRQAALHEGLNFRHAPWLFACGEMLDWDAPTGGYLLTACLATGRQAADGVADFLSK